MVIVRASRRAWTATDIERLSQLEVIEGPVWWWLLAGEIVAGSAVAGGTLVLATPALNETPGLPGR
ncbi:MAG: hypothetical protein ABI831_11955 [Betaproteobacteria bacterium]